MYVRRTDNQEHTFIVSGKLWRDSLVMLDVETQTHWSHISGKSFKGELAGRELEIYPSEMATWGEWVAAHPETKVLEKDEESRGLTASVYDRYFTDPERQGVFGRQVDDDRLSPKHIVVAVLVDEVSLAFPRDRLPADRVVQADVGETPVAVVPTPSGGYLAYSRIVGGNTVDLTLTDGMLKATGSSPGSWDAETGLPTGSAGGEPALQPLRAHVIYWFGWVSFYPEAGVWEGE